MVFSIINKNLLYCYRREINIKLRKKFLCYLIFFKIRTIKVFSLIILIKIFLIYQLNVIVTLFMLITNFRRKHSQRNRSRTF